MNEKKRVLSGMQPSGQFHLGNWKGALENWTTLQRQYDSFFMVADWHALTSRYTETESIPSLIREMVIDWLAAGLDPEQSIIFIQSLVPEHAELHLLLSMITPLGWLERVPSYKEKLKELAQRDIHTYGFLGYPVLQTADIALYQAQFVPVGQDQIPHVELTREIVRRFNGLFGPVLTEPDVLLTEAPVLPGLDGRKMSKSYGNTISFVDPAEDVIAKVKTMVTDPARVRSSDLGHPEVCAVFSYHQLFSPPDEVTDVEISCKSAQIGCVQCKLKLSGHLNQALEPIRSARSEWATRDKEVDEILRHGSKRAQAAARETMASVREALSLTVGRAP